MRNPLSVFRKLGRGVKVLVALNKADKQIREMEIQTMGNMLRNWKTSVSGVATIVTAIALYLNHPDKLNEAIATAAVGIGLLAAKDGDKSGTARVPRD